MSRRIPIVDLFAGPGGLSEGFSASRKNDIGFHSLFAVESDAVAARTLRLRKFFHSFDPADVPKAYYSYIRHPAEKRLHDLLESQFPNSGYDPESVVNGALGDMHIDDHVLTKMRALLTGIDDWVLVGGPPCQAYSLAGRSRMRTTHAGFENDHRHTLYRQYLRILAEFEPPVFVMENVRGLLSSKINGRNAFELIHEDLSAPRRALDADAGGATYRIVPVAPDGVADLANLHRPTDYIVRCEALGVPQARHRMIMVGLREDRFQMKDPAFLNRQEAQTPLWDVISDLPRIRSRLSRQADDFETWKTAVLDAADYADRYLNIDAAASTHKEVRRRAPASTGAAWIDGATKPKALADWFMDPRLEGVMGHQARSHMAADLQRYMFAASYGRAHGRSPTLRDFPDRLLPAHGNVGKGDAIPFADRFRVQLAGKPAKTITSHISKDGHYFIHPDPTQCRSLTMREAARIQTFPDNYFFEGNRTQQYVQIGNAVPPWAARQIADLVSDLLSGGYG